MVPQNTLRNTLDIVSLYSRLGRRLKGRGLLEGVKRRGSTARKVQHEKLNQESLALILVVEDFVDAREMIVEHLEFIGYRTAQAENGREAIELARRLQPQIILMDLAMPYMDGWEATHRLKANPATARIPIIAVTAHALPEEEGRAWKAGCDAFLTKPLQPEDLLRQLKEHLAN